jgi:hypothetical protein
MESGTIEWSNGQALEKVKGGAREKKSKENLATAADRGKVTAAFEPSLPTDCMALDQPHRNSSRPMNKCTYLFILLDKYHFFDSRGPVRL